MLSPGIDLGRAVDGSAMASPRPVYLLPVRGVPARKQVICGGGNRPTAARVRRAELSKRRDVRSATSGARMRQERLC